MRWLALYLRSRQVPAALAAAAGGLAVMWTLFAVFGETRDVDMPMVVLTVLLLVAALTATLGGPDDALESTAALRWLPRRLVHLLAAFLIVVALVLVTHATGGRFGPTGLVVRDVAGLLGLTALCAATIGTARAWFLPLAWTLAAVLFPRSEPAIGRILGSAAPDVVGVALLEVAGPEEEQSLPAPPGVEVRWLHRGDVAAGVHSLLADAVAGLEPPGTDDLFAWVAGESAAVRTIRADLRGRWGLSRAQHHAIGYWRLGRAMGG